MVMKQYSFNKNIKKINFPEEEIEQLSKQNKFITTRVSNDYNKYNVNDIVLTPWKELFKIVKRINISDIKKHPYYNELTKQQIDLLSKYKRICVLWAVKL